MHESDGPVALVLKVLTRLYVPGLYVELVGAAVGRQEGDGITCQKFEFELHVMEPKTGTQASAYRVLFQAVQEWEIRLIRLKGTSCA